MDISPRSGSKRAPEPVDDWLRTEGYFRKNAPHDATCLFRAVSEQIYLTQYYHLKVREQCVAFMRQNKELFEENVKIPLDNYLDQLSCVTEWGGNVEMQAMAQLYKRDFMIFNASKLERYKATDNGFTKFIYLCQMGPKVFESVFEREVISTAAFCQSLMYQTLYKDVFGMSGIDDVVQNMLHERSPNMRHTKFFLKTNLDNRDQLATELRTKMDPEDSGESPQRPRSEKAPFPYRIAKALDPNIYRNIDFDIWHELRKEVRCTGWTRWNDSELQIGAKCLVQLDNDKENINETNNNKTHPTSDPNGNPQESPNSVKKVPALLIGHIQEMSKDNGPVVVFIEELGEKKTVPFKSLKPLLATRKPHLPLGVISPRKNLPHDHSPKYRNKWTQSTRKPKESYNNLDNLNNNDCQDPKKSPNPDWEDSTYQNPTVILKPFTSVDNYHNNNFVNTMEVRPVSIVLDNPQPLMATPNDPRMETDEVNNKPSISPANNNNPMINNNNISQMDNYEKLQGVQGQGHPQGQGQVNEIVNPPPGLMHPMQTTLPSPIPPQQEPYYTQSHSLTPIYAPTPSVMCVSSEGMYPVQYYGQDNAPPPGQDRPYRLVNFTATMSKDANGSDLPFSDPVTLRFFYNLGIEFFRCGNMWPPGPVPFASSGPMSYVPPSNVVPMVSPVVAAEAPQSIQTPPRREEDAVRAGYQGKRRNDQVSDQRSSGRNSGMSSESRGSFRGNYPRKDQGCFQRDNGGNTSYEYQKGKGFGGEEKEVREQRDMRDQRKNGNRFNNNNSNKKGNDNRGRNFERNNSFQDYQKGRDGNFRGDNQSFRRAQADQLSGSAQGHVQGTVQGSPHAGGQPFQGSYQQPVYNEVYYSSEGQGFYPPSGNFYPIGFLPQPQEPPEGAGNYVCSGVENFQPPISPIYTQYVYPPPGVYSGVTPAGGQENWYSVQGAQGFVPYQVPVTQPPPNLGNRPPTSS
ncbi:protein ovarian tumor locus [Diachasma alloeum]|uniref:protein ovarian tumor locus n=1 Tax=Diachasma alloeum TaxID=454923 RepID=UPI00073831BA|nr:protein ovarian tumor locus [Diachasma alloeum]